MLKEGLTTSVLYYLGACWCRNLLSSGNSRKKCIDNKLKSADKLLFMLYRTNCWVFIITVFSCKCSAFVYWWAIWHLWGSHTSCIYKSIKQLRASHGISFICEWESWSWIWLLVSAEHTVSYWHFTIEK